MSANLDKSESEVAPTSEDAARQAENNQETAMVTESKTEVVAKAEKTEKESELDKYWKAVKENPNDFTGWTYLLQFVEQENNLKAAEEAYDAFFSHYPYCYGYWKKYSDMEKKFTDIDRALAVFERGVKAIPLSVELWLHYLNFYITEFGSNEDGEEKIRKLYERSITAAGTDFRSDKLWDSYISWENMRHNKKKVTQLYKRLLSIPTQLYSHHYDNFKKHVMENHPKDILSLDEFLKLRQEVVKAGTGKVEEDDAGAEVPPGEDAPPGVDAPPGEEAVGGMADEDEAKKLREWILEHQETIHRLNEDEVSKRWTYEEAIRRPYFHVKPLERAQLKNWREYLDFEIENGSHERVVVLFERCMIACALYEDFWMKYAKYLEQHNVDGVRSVYQRACTIHLLKKPYIHLSWAAFEERQGNYPEASDVLTNIEKNVPNLVMVSMRRISLERRQGNHENVENLYQSYITKAASPAIRSFYSIKFARYLRKIRGNVEKAREVLSEALEKDKKNEKLFLQLLDLEYQTQPIDEQRVLDVFSNALKSDLSADFKVKVSQRRMEFLEDFGTCIQRITDAYDEHQKLVKDHNSDRKKKHPDSIDDNHAPPEKKHKHDKYKSETNGSSATGDASSHHTSADANTYNYHWPSYSSSYAPYHSHYGAYGSYGSYYPS
ncbi:pre-mRNA-processing factor 39-like [Haliotis asinina]|uniref:pre-mRNA-processing factor 39-like n=1 Tax=Haliotis asinina TaxID=109174 RepID=UPI0035325076